MPSVSAYLRSRGLRDGLINGRKPWAIIGIIVWSFRILRKLATRRPELVAREVLKPGQSITITSIERSPQSSSGE